jgi:hypothetical protein
MTQPEGNACTPAHAPKGFASAASRPARLQGPVVLRNSMVAVDPRKHQRGRRPVSHAAQGGEGVILGQPHWVEHNQLLGPLWYPANMDG